MLRFINPFKKKAESKKESLNKNIANQVKSFNLFSKERLRDIVCEFRLIKERMKNLSETNYNLGLRYLNDGNLSEAAFRFNITKKFWPDNHEAHYQLVYCLLMLHKVKKAKIIAQELIAKNTEYENKIKELFSNEEIELE